MLGFCGFLLFAVFELCIVCLEGFIYLGPLLISIQSYPFKKKKKKPKFWVLQLLLIVTIKCNNNIKTCHIVQMINKSL